MKKGVNGVTLKEERPEGESVDIKLRNLKIFFSQAAELLQKTGEYSGQIKYKTMLRKAMDLRGIYFYWSFLVVFQEIPRFLWFPRRVYILAFVYDSNDVRKSNLNEFGKEEVTIDIYDLKECESLVKILKPLAQKLHKNTGLPVILNKQPNLHHML